MRPPVAEGGKKSPAPTPAPGHAGLSEMVEAVICNRSIRPGIYGVAEQLPFLNIGLARNRDLQKIPDIRKRYRRGLSANVHHHFAIALDVQST